MEIFNRCERIALTVASITSREFPVLRSGSSRVPGQAGCGGVPGVPRLDNGLVFRVFYPAMVETRDITDEIVLRIRKTMNPKQIILFGSRARGDEHPDSDFDILVIAESRQPRFKRSAPIYAEVADLPCELDAVVYTQEEVDDWMDVPKSLVSTALHDGIVLYEAEA
jgi:predicted nucleotidyltransferase